MKIQTLEQLATELDQALAWRKQELINIIGKIEEKKKPQKFLARALICLLYAHWEGYIKQASDFYLNFVHHTRSKNSELSAKLIGFVSLRKIGSEYPKKYQTREAIVSRILNQANAECDVPHKNAVYTDSNLSSSVLKDICFLLEIDFGYFELRTKLIDVKLVESRNKIAHGESLAFDGEDSIEVHEKVIEMLDAFKDELLNSAVLKKYRKA